MSETTKPPVGVGCTVEASNALETPKKQSHFTSPIISLLLSAGLVFALYSGLSTFVIVLVAIALAVSTVMQIANFFCAVSGSRKLDRQFALPSPYRSYSYPT